MHRDLKPENILLTGPATGHPGQVKILDFGLAKTLPRRAAISESSETLTPVHTETGMVMGTPCYMSPEQVRGAELDHRSDIFSFFLILYELLSGRRAFQADTSVETMTAILKHEAPELPETVPAGLRRIVAHCLEKDPRNRFQSAKDLAFALAQNGIQTSSLTQIRESPSGPRILSSAANQMRSLHWRERLTWALYGFAALAVALGTC